MHLNKILSLIDIVVGFFQLYFYLLSISKLLLSPFLCVLPWLQVLLWSFSIKERSKSIQKANKSLKESSRQRRNLLLASKKYQEFQRDAEELLLWMEEKFKVAEDESYRDPTNILRKLKKHEAAEKEMQANQVWLDRLVQVNGRPLMLAEEHPNSQSISRKSSLLSSRWRRLQDKMADRGDKLRQAGQQEQLMELLQWECEDL
uniref:Uncharacterized protein n=1 Tax=Amphiprion percula TaxID=161767 RepID=A0A3P8T279_AMPPE